MVLEQDGIRELMLEGRVRDAPILHSLAQVKAADGAQGGMFDVCILCHFHRFVSMNNQF